LRVTFVILSTTAIITCITCPTRSKAVSF
jgi:hypothetical protein